MTRVWAPKARRVDVVLGASREPMRAAPGGWWAGPSLRPGTDYRFALDGGDPMPDPRSPWQPDGVHGPSRTVDHAAFVWSDDGFAATPLADAIIYELHLGTFSDAGTFDAAIGRLDALVDLGITHVELMPVAEFSGDRGWGYDGVDLFAPHHAYGGPDGLKRLVDAAHARGLGVLLDVVYNHLGPEGNVLGAYGPYFTDRYRTPWGEAMNYDDVGSHEVRRFVVDNAVGWLRDYHLDGLRLDAIHAIHDASAIHILEEVAAAVHALAAEIGRPLVVIAESDLNDPRLVRPPEVGGYGLDAAWADDVHHAIHVALTGEDTGYYADFVDPAAVVRAVRTPYLYTGGYSAFRDRPHGRDPVGVSGERFVVFVQNHDQVGNRALGERIGHLVSEGRQRIAAALLLTSPYVPLLFAGEEWGASTPFRYFTGHTSPELADAVRRGRRAEFAAFGWDPDAVPDPQDRATFDASRLCWNERHRSPHAGMLTWYRQLIGLRRSVPALRDGDRDAVVARFDEGTRALSLRRGPVEVVANLGPGSVRLALSGEPRLRWPDDLTVDAEGVCLPADGVVIATGAA